MDFSKLTQDELQEFFQYYVLLTQVEQAEILFNKLLEKQENVSIPVADLYLASIYQGPKNRTYSKREILDMSEENVNTFLEIFGINRDNNGDINMYKQRILRILGFLGLIHKEGNEFLTGDFSVDTNILSYVDDKELEKFCLTDKYAYSLCESDNLWINKISMLANDQVIKDKPGNQSARYFYFYLKDLLNAEPISGTSTSNEKKENIVAGKGQLEILKWLDTKGILPDIDGLNDAINNSHFETIKWLYTKGISPEEDSIDYAYGRGKLEILKWLETKNIFPYNVTANEAARLGELEILEWLAQPPRNILPDQKAINRGDFNDNLNVLQWLAQPPRNMLPNQEGIFLAAAEGHLNVLQWLAQPPRNIFPDQKGINRATENRHLDMVKWLASMGLLPDQQAVNSASFGASLEFLKWLAEPPRNILPDQKGANKAARGGRLETLEWLETKGILPDQEGANEAAEGYADNILEILKWLETRGILPNQEGANKAATSYFGNSLKVIKWLAERLIFPTKDGVTGSLKAGNRDVFDWLKSKGFITQKRE